MENETVYEGLKLENQLCFPLYACARRIMNLYTPYLKELGLTYTQYLVMIVLWEERECTVGELCRRLYLDSGTLTPMLKKMELAGLVKRARSLQDERVVKVSLTQEGWQFRDRALGMPSCVDRAMPLSPEEAEQLYTLLYKILIPEGQCCE